MIFTWILSPIICRKAAGKGGVLAIHRRKWVVWFLFFLHFYIRFYALKWQRSNSEELLFNTWCTHVGIYRDKSASSVFWDSEGHFLLSTDIPGSQPNKEFRKRLNSVYLWKEGIFLNPARESPAAFWHDVRAGLLRAPCLGTEGRQIPT